MWTLFEHILRDGHRREDIGPTDMEGQLRNGLGGLRLGQAVIHRPVEVRHKLRRLPVGDQRADRDETAVSWYKVRAQPQIAEQHVGRVLCHSRKERAKLRFDTRRALRLGGFVDR